MASTTKKTTTGVKKRKLVAAKSYIKTAMAPKKAVAKRIATTAKKAIITAKKTTTAVKKASNKVLLDSVDLTVKIQEKAYQVFEKRGFRHGDDLFDWAIAEKLVNAEIKKPKKRVLASANLIKQKAGELFELRAKEAADETFDWLLAEELIKVGA
ncbi:MAG: DUF2934 domain-containing protein [Candidatus Zapsychrus exili]|nr:DUF2934 domain-containing protein [Candidatus Zapsychrus exili]